MIKKLVLTGLFLWVAMALFAQQDTTSHSLDEVILTSQRKAQKELLVPYSTQSITRPYLENYQPRTLPEALTGINGVFVQKTNHGGGSPFLRGLTGNQTLILVDGIRLNNSTFRYGPNQYLNTIDAFSINKMEVVKGTGSVQYGSDAMGGVIQVFSKEPPFSDGEVNWTGKAYGRYMTGNMEKTVRGEAAYQTQNAAAQIGATYRHFGDLIGGDITGRQSPSGYKEFAFNAKTKFQLQPTTVLTLAHRFLKQQHVPVYHRIVLENFAVNEFHPQQRMLNYAKLNVGSSNKWLNNFEVIASWQQSIEGRVSRKNGSTTLRNERDEVNTFGLTADVSSFFSNTWTANSGIELYNDKVNSTREDVNTSNDSKKDSRGLYPDDSRYGNYSLYTLHHFTLNKWFIESGIRFNTFAIRIQDTSLGNVKISPSSFVYNAALLYKLSHQQSAFINFSTGYRAPNVDDMGTLGIVDFRFEIPTADLAPEKSRNIEAGYKLQLGKWATAISGFYMHLNDLITRVRINGEERNGYPVYKKENVGKGYIKGFEAEIGYRPVAGWTFQGNVAYAYGQSLTNNEPLRRIPPLNGRLLSSYQYKGWFGAAEWLFASKQDRLAQGDKEDNRIPAGGTPGWNVFNLYAGYEWKDFKFNVGLQNLLNEDYRTHGSGINGVGRSAWFSVALKI